MKIILLADIDKIGKKDEIILVSDGYANNYLIPKNKAIKYDSAEAQPLLKIIKEKEKKREEEKEVQREKSKFMEDTLDLKRKFFTYIINYQILEDVMFQCCVKDIIDQPLINKCEHLSMFELLLPFFTFLKENGPCRKQKYADESDIQELSVLFSNIKRNETIHDSTLSFNNDILLAESLDERETNIERETKCLCDNLDNILKIMDKLLLLGFELNTIFEEGRKRKISHSRITISYTKINKNFEDFTSRFGNSKDVQLKKNNKFIIQNYYQLVSEYNFIHNNLRYLIKLINKREFFWNSKEIEMFLTKKDLGECVKQLELLSKKNVKLQIYLEKIPNFLRRAKEICMDRNYRIHYFYVDYYRKYKKYYKNDNNIEHKFDLYNKTMSSLVFAREFNNELYCFIDSLKSANKLN